nr:T9SS type A sorting domain-containing protein [Bacteroidota bacterium]
MTDKLLFNSDAQLLKVDVSKLKPGIYILVMKNASGAHSYRFVKM